MTPITSIKGAEDCLPKKYHVMRELINQENVLSNREISRQSHNKTIDELSNVCVEIDEEALIEIITWESFDNPITPLSDYLAKAIASQPQHFLRLVKKGGEDVKE